jgi:hypothetical protein
MRLAGALLAGWALYSAPAPTRKLVATAYNSGFEFTQDAFNSIGTASDGRIYYVLSSSRIDTGGQMYVFDPAAKKIHHLGDLAAAAGEKDRKVNPQGKSHVGFVEAGGKLYFATQPGVSRVPEGSDWAAYEGGHFLAWDMKGGKFEDLAVAPNREGIIAMNMDVARGRLYGLTAPSGHFIRYDLKSQTVKDLGGFFLEGERGKGPNYRGICRSIAVDPRDGSAYFTTGDGSIYRYRFEGDNVARVEGDSLKKDYFGVYDPSSNAHMAYNWRQTLWSPRDGQIYGVHGNSGYLFRFDPRAERVEVLERITSEPSRRSGMADQFRYGYLGLGLGPDGRTIYYLTGGRIEGDRSQENLHLVTWETDTAKYTDRGAVFFANGERPRNVNSIAVGKDGTVYALAQIREGARSRTDLISIAVP